MSEYLILAQSVHSARPRDNKNFNCSYKLKYRQIKKFLPFNLSDVAFIMLINVKMPTIVGILTFMSRINFVLS